MEHHRCRFPMEDREQLGNADSIIANTMINISSLPTTCEREGAAKPTGQDSSDVAEASCSSCKENGDKPSRKKEKMYISHNYNDLAWVTEEKAKKMFPGEGSPTKDNPLKETAKKKNIKKSKPGALVRGGVVEPFPLKLHRMLDTCESQGLTHVVSWLPHGRAFLVHDAESFVAFVLPEYSNQKKITSFHRQLQLYGFMRITRGADSGAYYHERFLIGRPYLCRSMYRTKVKGLYQKPIIDPTTEPNFYMMPHVTRYGDALKRVLDKETKDEEGPQRMKKPRVDGGIKDLLNGEGKIAHSDPNSPPSPGSKSPPSPVAKSPSPSTLSENPPTGNSRARTSESLPSPAPERPPPSTLNNLGTRRKLSLLAKKHLCNMSSSRKSSSPKNDEESDKIEDHPQSTMPMVDPDSRQTGESLVTKNYLRHLGFLDAPAQMNTIKETVDEVPSSSVKSPAKSLVDPDGSQTDRSQTDLSQMARSYPRSFGSSKKPSPTSSIAENDEYLRQAPSLATVPSPDLNLRHANVSLMARSYLRSFGVSSQPPLTNNIIGHDHLLGQVPLPAAMPHFDAGVFPGSYVHGTVLTKQPPIPDGVITSSDHSAEASSLPAMGYIPIIAVPTSYLWCTRTNVSGDEGERYLSTFNPYDV